MGDIQYTSKRGDICCSEITIMAAIEPFKTYVSVILPITRISDNDELPIYSYESTMQETYNENEDD